MRGFRCSRLHMRASSFVGVFVMLSLTAMIAAAAAQIMATALGAPGPGRFAAIDTIARADPTVKLGHGDNADKVDVQRSALLPATAVERVRRVAGVRSAVGDVTFPVTVIGRDGVPLKTTGGASAHAHGWPSAGLTPYRLTSGARPSRSRRDRPRPRPRAHWRIHGRRPGTGCEPGRIGHLPARRRCDLVTRAAGAPVIGLLDPGAGTDPVRPWSGFQRDRDPLRARHRRPARAPAARTSARRRRPGARPSPRVDSRCRRPTRV